MRRTLIALLALALALPLTVPVRAAEDKLVVYTAYEENELKDFWEQFKRICPTSRPRPPTCRAPLDPPWPRSRPSGPTPGGRHLGRLQRLPDRRGQEGPPEPYAAKDS
jgi:hypothetical protein